MKNLSTRHPLAILSEAPSEAKNLSTHHPFELVILNEAPKGVPTG